jgi:hypothetical protein
MEQICQLYVVADLPGVRVPVHVYPFVKRLIEFQNWTEYDYGEMSLPVPGMET